MLYYEKSGGVLTVQLTGELDHNSAGQLRRELDELILSTRGRELEWIDDRKERAAQFQQAVKRCDLRELLCLVGCIYRRRLDLTAAGKKLPAADETVLRRAEGLIENELGFVLDLEGPQVGAYIREKLGIEEE